MIARQPLTSVMLFTIAVGLTGCNSLSKRDDTASTPVQPVSLQTTSEESPGRLNSAAKRAGELATGVAGFVVKGIWKGIWESIFGPEETMFEKERRLARERPWKQYWRDNPGVNPAMTEAFKDDYR